MNSKVQLFKILADPTRYKIIKLILKKGDELCVSDIAKEVGVSQSAVSHQLAKLEDEEIVSGVRNGQEVCYLMTDTRNARRVKRVLKAVKNQND